MVRSRIPGTVQRFLGSCSFEEPYQSEMVWPKKGKVMYPHFLGSDENIKRIPHTLMSGESDV